MVAYTTCCLAGVPRKSAAAGCGDEEILRMVEEFAGQAGLCSLSGGLRFYVRLLVSDQVYGREPFLTFCARYQNICYGDAEKRLPRSYQTEYAEAMVRSSAAY